MDVVPEDEEYLGQATRDRSPSLKSLPQLSPTRGRNSTLHRRTSVPSLKSATYVYLSTLNSFSPFLLYRSPDTEPEIVSPVPRRHLLHVPGSVPWLKAGAFSDVNGQARRTSPVSTVSSTQSVVSPSSGKRLSFSVLLEQERQDRVTAIQKTQREDVMDQGAVRRWVRWMHKHNMKDFVVPCAIAASTCVKCCISLADYSGMFLIHIPYIECH